METDFKNISGMFRTNTDIINKAIADVRPEDWFRTPGNDSNHLMWLLGHVVVHRGLVLKTIGTDWSSSWSGLFKPGAERVDDAQYPTVDEMRAAWDEISERLKAAFREPPEDVLTRPSPERFPSFDKKVSGNVAFLAFHDAYHTGQIGFLRKWLGYGQTIG